MGLTEVSQHHTELTNVEIACMSVCLMGQAVLLVDLYVRTNQYTLVTV
jgi:hypothetical protein